jgi:hypothetical protein
MGCFLLYLTHQSAYSDIQTDRERTCHDLKLEIELDLYIPKRRTGDERRLSRAARKWMVRKKATQQPPLGEHAPGRQPLDSRQNLSVIAGASW